MALTKCKVLLTNDWDLMKFVRSHMRLCLTSNRKIQKENDGYSLCMFGDFFPNQWDYEFDVLNMFSYLSLLK
jgi:hypothetical protein